MSIYDRIKELRLSLGWSQDELARRMGYKDRSMITKIESGLVDISQKKISKFADVLHTTTSYLMGWSDPSSLEALSSDEQFIVDTYRTLSEPGKQYIHQQFTIASHMFGEKHEDADQANPG